MSLLTVSARNTQTFLPIGFDGGHGGIKAIVNGNRYFVPAYFKRLTFRPHELPPTGFVEYQEGTSNPKTKCWYVGNAALEQDPEGVLRIGDNPKGKVEYALEALLGILSHLPYQVNYSLAIAASIHDAKSLGDELLTALSFECIAKFNNYPTATKIKSQVSIVREEGHPALLTHKHEVDLNAQNITLDIGNGTIIASLFGTKGRLVDRKPFARAGVQRLIADIAVSDEFTRYLGGEIANEQYIRAALENPDYDQKFQYGTTGFNFKHIYDAKLRTWVESSLAPAVKFLKPWRANASCALVIGGGALLPGVREALETAGFVVSSDPVWANAQGLYELTQMLKLGEVA
jgi:hypothetical protein